MTTIQKPNPLRCRCGGLREKRWHLVCPTCWERIPAPLKGELYDAYREKDGSPRHIAAIRQCFVALGKP